MVRCEKLAGVVALARSLEEGLDSLLGVVRQTPYRLYLLIDEYDNFVNEVMVRDVATYKALFEADGLLVVGSSLMVWSGYRFVRAARDRGLEVAAVNLGRTRADAEVTLKIEVDCAEALPAALG